MTPVAQPKLNYLAPEYALTSSCDPASDLFAVGILIHALHNGGRPIFDSMSDWTIFRKNADQVEMVCLIDVVCDCNDFLKNYWLHLKPIWTAGSSQKSGIYIYAYLLFLLFITGSY